MKRLFALLLCVLMISMLAACSKEAEKEEEKEEEKAPATSVVVNDDTFYFTDIDSESVKITGFETKNSQAHAIKIPAYLDGKIVARIESDAFGNAYSITKIEFPTEAEFKAENDEFSMAEYSMTIGVGAFRECTLLESITIPAYVETIDEMAFASCPALKTVVFAQGDQRLEALPANLFYNCTALTSVTLPASLQTVGTAAFYGCTALTEIVFLNVTEIGAQAFQGCTALAEIFVPEGLTDENIGAHAIPATTKVTRVLG
ncbi:MAG: leucine-rich repeat domain-containing protein [Clostridia bacterium]|nr:leucine-rich repeat domain-containing protein [Clostridia bacterium]